MTWRWRNGLQAKEWRQPLGAGKGKETDFPVELPEGTQFKRQFHLTHWNWLWASAFQNCKRINSCYIFFFNFKSLTVSCSTDWPSWAAQKDIISLEKNILMFYYSLLCDSNRYILSSENIAMKFHANTTWAGSPKFWYAEFSVSFSFTYLPFHCFFFDSRVT